MVRAGIYRPVTMQISGHKTESVFNRCDITDDRDLDDAAVKLESYRKNLGGHNFGHNPENLDPTSLQAFLFYLMILVPRAGIEPAQRLSSEGF